MLRYLWIAGLVLVDVAPRVENRGIQRILDFMTAAPDGFASLEEAAADSTEEESPNPEKTPPQTQPALKDDTPIDVELEQDEPAEQE